MRLAVFGATGRTGHLVVGQALSAYHQVTAFVRSPSRLGITHDRLETVWMPTPDPAALRTALTGMDAVVSVLGGSMRQGAPATTWTAAVLEAMGESGMQRLVVTSAAPVGLRNTRPPLPYRVVGWIFRDAHRDLAAMEDIVCGSAAEWTLIRPPRLTNRPRTGQYRMVLGGNVPRGLSISRADLAEAVLRIVDRADTVKQPVGIAY